MRALIRRSLPAVLSRLPDVRGRGRLTLLADRLVSKGQPHEIVGTINGFPMFLDLRAFGHKFAYYYREWEPEYVATLRRLYRGGLFIDVGSSLGLYVICLSDLVRRAGARILSIEPLLHNVARQRRNLQLNGIEDLVDLVVAGLGSKAGEVRLCADATGADNNAFVSQHGSAVIPVVPLDALCRDRGVTGIGMMKIDIEGYEPEAIAGARQTIATERPLILAEFNRERMEINGTSIEPSWEFLMRNGYRAWRLEGNRLRRLAEPGSYENLFFTPDDAQ